jgi:hypothetical protein
MPDDRPDPAERLRGVPGAASHDEWFRGQVARALRQADQPAAPWIAGEAVMRALDSRIERLRILRGPPKPPAD